MLAPTPFFADRGCHVRILEEARALLPLGVELRLWRGLSLRVFGQVEYIGLSFAQPPAAMTLMPPCPCGTTGGATDLYYGGGAALGYAF